MAEPNSQLTRALCRGGRNVHLIYARKILLRILIVESITVEHALIIILVEDIVIFAECPSCRAASRKSIGFLIIRTRGDERRDSTGRKTVRVVGSNYNCGFSLVIVVTNFSPDTICLLYTSPSPRDRTRSRMPSSA